MAAIGRAARAQIGQLCVARHHLSVARFRTISQAALDRSQSTSVPNVVPAGKTWEEFGVTHPVWCHDTLSGYFRGYATKDGADKVTGAGKTSDSSGDIGEEMRVDTMVRDELEEPAGGPEPGVKEKAKQAVSAVGEKVKDAGKAIKGSTDSKGPVEKVGNAVEGAGDTIKDNTSNKTSLGKEDVVTS